MCDDEILTSLEKKAQGGDIEAVKALLEYRRSKNYETLLNGLDDDESTGETSIPNQLQLN